MIDDPLRVTELTCFGTTRTPGTAAQRIAVTIRICETADRLCWVVGDGDDDPVPISTVRDGGSERLYGMLLAYATDHLLTPTG